MNIEGHNPNSHLGSFLESHGDRNEEQDDRFHEDLWILEKKWKDHWDSCLMGS